MKIKVLFFASVLLVACEKDAQPDVDQNQNLATDYVQSKAIGADKWMDLTNDLNPCQPGDEICTYYCCITPEMQQFMDAIDTGTERTFLSNIDLEILINGDQIVKEALTEVRDGTMKAEYDETLSNVGFSFISIDGREVVNYVLSK